ncbi:hypothetical protein POUND7_020397 [Theobroma cacao]
MSLLSRYMQSPFVLHFKATKWVFRYIKGTLSYWLKFDKHESKSLKGYCDND